MHRHEFDDDDNLVHADVVKIGFCPECGNIMLVLALNDRDIAIAHLQSAQIDSMIADLQSIRHRIN